MIRLLPRSPRGTWLLAAAVWLATCGALWWMLPPAPRAEWRVPFDPGERCISTPSVVAVRPDRRTVAVVENIIAWNDSDFTDGRELAFYRGPVCILDAEADRERGRFLTREDKFMAVGASPDSRWLALTGRGESDDNRNALVVIDVEGNRRLDLPDAVYRPRVGRRFAFVPDGSAIVYAWRNDEAEGLRIWDLGAGRVIREIKDAWPPVVVGEGGRVLAFVATSQGRQVIRVAELPDLRMLGEIPTQAERVRNLSVSADGRRVATVYERQLGGAEPHSSVHFWDTATGAELVQRPDEYMRLTSDGEMLVTWSCSTRRPLVAWDLSSERPRWERDLPEGAGASLSKPDIEPLRGYVFVGHSHDHPWNGVRDWVERAGMKWPFSRRRDRDSGELIDIVSGRSVVSLPFQMESTFPSTDGPLAVTGTFDQTVFDEAVVPRVEVWDIPPRKSVWSFTARTALLAVPLFLIARRRVRRLREEAAA